MAALEFCYDALRHGGHFMCKFYQGAEDKALELKLRALFERVYREKPASSRKVRYNVPHITSDKIGIKGKLFRSATATARSRPLGAGLITVRICAARTKTRQL